jgi:dTDP-4-amino-4,6-dideoxygalactose transaminase
MQLMKTDDKSKPVYVTRPSVPPLDRFVAYLEDIWESRWLTNNGKYHRQFEQALCDYLGVKYCSLFTNGTLALVVGLQAQRITGEVITTPYSFVATTHALHWNRITPVFCDITEDTFTIDPARIESLVTPDTTAILPVHVYGRPCRVKEIDKIADTYGLKVIYDAAHAFGVRMKGDTILSHGDMSILSFHATKVFNTMEGGAIVTDDEQIKKRVDFLKNFGFADEVTVVAPGINAKMNELQACYGLLQLEGIEEEIGRRKTIADYYRQSLAGVPGVTAMPDMEGVKHNYQYFPVLIDEEKTGKSRDEVYEELKSHNIFARRYFYPLISRIPAYRDLPSAAPGHLPVAEKVSREILCLPLYGELETGDVDRICSILAGGTS